MTARRFVSVDITECNPLSGSVRRADLDVVRGPSSQNRIRLNVTAALAQRQAQSEEARTAGSGSTGQRRRPVTRRWRVDVTDSSAPALVRLSRTDVPNGGPFGDLRRRWVVTVDEASVGTVIDLLIDRQRQTIRFLEIDAEGLDVIGQRMILIPVEAVNHVDAGHVFLNCAREAVATAPTYNQHVVLSLPYLREVYEHFGFPLPGAAPGVPGSEMRH
jgi:hypothetical protein